MRQTFFSIALLIIILATGFVWYRYIRTPAPAAPAPSGEAESERLSQYRRLRKLEFRADVLSDPIFKSLQSVGAPLTSPTTPPGRSNPFTPF
jgi:hypothetical protein